MPRPAAPGPSGRSSSYRTASEKSAADRSAADLRRAGGAPRDLRVGLAAAVGVNLIVAVAFWAAAVLEVGYDGVAYDLELWSDPVCLFLAVSSAAALVCLCLTEWRRLGFGLLAGTLLVLLLDATWLFVHVALLGS